jgi:ferredoxin
MDSSALIKAKSMPNMPAGKDRQKPPRLAQPSQSLYGHNKRQPQPGGNMAIVIDHDECIGCETCVELCPEVFAMIDGEEKAMVKAPDSSADCVQDAIDGCPVSAISKE